MPSHIRTPDEPQQLALSSSMQESSHWMQHKDI
jgi:hypothetical protein